ncbi:two-partner secretion domain-containing protein [Chroococcidiopsis sp.]|uniref:two-partner secretion domain-containing protein n=1 Tax=Chroococcidiopsis sp. TaxID=3088168 RepID=UPI003F3E6910
MSAIYIKWSEKLGRVSFLATGVALACWVDSASAQITPDNTMGGENSRVTSSGKVDAIDGGATRGTNLFHSFQEFNVEDGRAAIFNNPAGIANILTRVTGANPSNILGTLGVAGNANLFLLNPNGIIFGPNARLDVRGSFVGSTASSINFADGTSFSATAPTTTPLLTISVPMGLQMGQNPGAIAVQGNGYNLSFSDIFSPTIKGSDSIGLQVSPGQTLALVGGDVDIQGATLTATQGRIELGSVADGQVSLNRVPEGLALGYQNVQRWGDIRLSQRALADASDGSIQVRGNNVLLADGSLLLIQNQERGGGRINVNAASNVKLSSPGTDYRISGGIKSENLGAMSGADIAIFSRQLTIQDGAFLGTSTFSSGRAGNVVINASDSMQVIGFSSISPFVGSGVGSRVFGSSGDAGDVTVSTGKFTALDGGYLVSVSLGTGRGGDVTVNANRSVELRGRAPFTGSALNAAANNQGNAGKLTINTSKLLVQDGALITSGTTGMGNGGSLTINARESVEVSGPRLGSFPPSYIGSVADRASEIIRQVILSPPVPTGFSGDATINTPRLSVTDGAFVGVSHNGIGDAGTLRLNANSIFVDTGGVISAATLSGQGGNLNLQVRDLLVLRRGGQITTSAGGTGNGGNIRINTPFLITIPNENSDIRANSVNARGGNVTIDATGIFGTQFRDRADDRTSDITATGGSPQLSGNVELDVPEIDPNSGLVNLPSVPVDTQIAQTCTPSSAQNQSEFIVTGRGGLPPNPTQVLSSDAISIDWVALQPTTENQSSPTPATNSTTPPAPIIEAQGWEFDRQGEVILTASNVPAPPQNSWQSSAVCNPS